VAPVQTLVPDADGGGSKVAGLEFDDNIAQLLDKSIEESEKKRNAGSILMSRHNSFNLKAIGLIPTSISISFENILATLPVIGHPYPTFQHIGSIDAIVTLGLSTTSKDALSAMANLYALFEDQARKARRAPQGLKNIKVTNSLVNMCGIHDMIIENMVSETVPGTTDTYNIQLTLVDNPLDASVRDRKSVV
jgi:hypothetical protein